MNKFFVLCVVVFAFSLSASAEIKYTITDLGTLGGSSSQAFGINSSGQVVGWAWNQGNSDQYAFLYSNGVMQNLGDLSAQGQRPGSFAYGGINDNGQITGIGDLHAFFYSNGVMHDVGTLNGGPRSAGQAINNKGQVVGYSWTPDNVSHAFLYSNGSMQDLGSNSITAYGINDSGQIVGQLNTNVPQHAFLYSNGVMQDLGTISGPNSIATGINNIGQIVGWTDIDNSQNTHAALWQDGSILDLGSLGGHSYAMAINNNAEIVGNALTDRGTKAFLYSDGVMEDLNNLIDPALNWSLTSAQSINDTGQIVGYGVEPFGQQHAFLLTPITIVPEPTTLFPFSLTVLVLLRRR